MDLIFGSLVSFLSMTPARLWAEDTPPASVVVEGVAPRSAAERAGLRVQDEVHSWTRAATADRPLARGRVESPFDLLAVEIEQAKVGLPCDQTEFSATL